jgi:hypothetical protein
MTDETRFQRSDVESNVPTLSLNIRVKSNEAIQNVLLTVHVNSPLCAQPNETRMGHIGGSYFNIIFNIYHRFLLGTAAIGTATIAFWMRDDLTPWNLEATFTVSYNTLSDSKIVINLIKTLCIANAIDVYCVSSKMYRARGQAVSQIICDRTRKR